MNETYSSLDALGVLCLFASLITFALSMVTGLFFSKIATPVGIFGVACAVTFGVIDGSVAGWVFAGALVLANGLLALCGLGGEG